MALDSIITPAVISGAVGSGFNNLAKKAVDGFLLTMDISLRSIFSDFGESVRPHLLSNYERCLKVKTIVMKDHPVDLLTIYVNTQFQCGSEEIDDYDLIEVLAKKKRIIVSGTGGGGKTVFVKYLWLSLSTGTSGKISIFIELRKLNDISSTSLMTYIHNSIVSGRSRISEPSFQKAANNGSFVFILDGFDEITEDRKKSVQDDILKFSFDNPNATIIVSGRPDPRFNSWQAFSTYQVKPMSKNSIIELLEKIDYDRDMKKKFIDKVREGLYEQHKSFLSTPLLATMMLLTFTDAALIPEKIFLFYDQAFDALYSMPFIRGTTPPKKDSIERRIQNLQLMFLVRFYLSSV